MADDPGGFASPPPGPPARVDVVAPRPFAVAPGWQVVLFVGAAALAVVWFFVVDEIRALDRSVDDIADSFVIDASAVQISQLADQGMLEAIGWLSIGVAATAVFGVLVALAFAFARR